MSERVRTAVLIVLVVSLLAACSTATSVPPPPIPMPTAEPKSAADVAALDAYLTDLLRKDQFSGTALVAQDDRVLLSRGYGLAVRGAGIKNTPDTLFDIGSLTQQFLDVAILILAQEGKVDLQASVCDFLDDCPAEWEPITVHQLMTEWTFPLRELGSRSDVAKVINSEASSGGSETDWFDECSQRMLLAHVLEQVSGQSHEDLIQTAILEPLGMQHTGFTVGRFDDDAVPYGGYECLSGNNDCHNLFSTVTDLHRWNQALSSDELLPAEFREQIFSPHVDRLPGVIGGPDAYGYGWSIYEHPDHPHYAGRSAYCRGYWSLMARYPDDGLILIVLANHLEYDPYSLCGFRLDPEGALFGMGVSLNLTGGMDIGHQQDSEADP